MLCEDAKSSKIYLDEAKIHFRASADIEISHPACTDPLGIVRTAAKKLKLYEKVYCVIDRDSHENFDNAVMLASQYQAIGLIRSHPCFEFWLLLHFCFTRAPYMASGTHSSADKVVKELRCKPGMGDYAKGSTKGLFALLLSKLNSARVNSAKTLLEAQADGEMNPSSEMHKLIEEMDRLGRLRPIN